MKKWETVLTPNAREWWSDFLDNTEENATGAAEDTDCPLFSLKKDWHRPVAIEDDVGVDVVTVDDRFQEKETAPLEEVRWNKLFFGKLYNCIAYSILYFF